MAKLLNSSYVGMQFHFDQSKFRSEIRLREGRTKPIDVLLKNLNFADEFDVELNEPYLVFKVYVSSCNLFDIIHQRVVLCLHLEETSK
jgi:hypothetical protein